MCLTASPTFNMIMFSFSTYSNPCSPHDGYCKPVETEYPSGRRAGIERGMNIVSKSNEKNREQYIFDNLPYDYDNN